MSRVTVVSRDVVARHVMSYWSRGIFLVSLLLWLYRLVFSLGSFSGVHEHERLTSGEV